MTYMSYIDLINSFWDSATTNPLSTGQVSLYFALLHVCNRSNWIEWFAAPNQVLSVLTGLSRSGILKARNELKQRGLIDFKERGTKATTYCLCLLIAKSTQDGVQKSTRNGVQDSVRNGVQKGSTLKDIDLDQDIKKSMSNDIPEKSLEPKFLVESFEMRCVDRLINSILEQLPGAKVPKTVKAKDAWAVEIDRMKRLDKRSEAEILEALEYAMTDPFWKTNILSTAKLREKYEKLILQARRKKGNTKGDQRKPGASTKFHNFEERKYDYDAAVWGDIKNRYKKPDEEGG